MDRIPAEESPAPPYLHTQEQHLQEETGIGKGDDKKAISPAPERRVSPPASESASPQHSPSTSLRPGSRSSTGSLASVPISFLPDGTAIWSGQQILQHDSRSQRSLPQSHQSGKDNFQHFQHDGQAVSNGGDQQSLHLDSISVENSSPQSSHPLANPPSHYSQTPVKERESQKHQALFSEKDCVSQKPLVDAESLKHEKRLVERGRLSSGRKVIIGFSIAVALLALLAMCLILYLHTSKKMARAGFTGVATTVFFCVAAVLWAADRTMVETLIAMNIVIVYGIFLNGQIDVFLNYDSTAR